MAHRSDMEGEAEALIWGRERDWKSEEEEGRKANMDEVDFGVEQSRRERTACAGVWKLEINVK